MLISMKVNVYRERGATMVEILITVLVVAVGLLGLANMQLASLRASHSAQMRSIVTQLTYDIGDRMRANLAARASYLNVGAPAAAVDCSTAPCTSDQLAAYDLTQWSAMIKALLPGGVGIVCADATPQDTSTPTATGCDAAGDLLAVKIWWLDERNSSEYKSFVTAFRL